MKSSKPNKKLVQENLKFNLHSEFCQKQLTQSAIIRTCKIHPLRIQEDAKIHVREFDPFAMQTCQKGLALILSTNKNDYYSKISN